MSKYNKLWIYISQSYNFTIFIKKRRSKECRFNFLFSIATSYATCTLHFATYRVVGGKTEADVLLFRRNHSLRKGRLNLNIKKTIGASILLFAMTLTMSSCQVKTSLATNDVITGEEYPDAEKYQTGAFTYDPDNVNEVEIYWRSGEVEITESEDSMLCVEESGSELAEDTALHYFLDDGVLRIRFCKSGEKVVVDKLDKHLHIEVPRGIDVSIHTTSALVKACDLTQKNILVAALSGDTELSNVAADTVDLSSGSGSISTNNISTENLRCSTSTGNVNLGLAKDGAKVLFTTSSGNLLTDCAFEQNEDLYVFGDGAGNITVKTTSGNLKVE